MARKRTDSHGRTIREDECQGFDLRMDDSNPRCKGDVHRCEKDDVSFGVPFTTHANLCDSHATALGYHAVADVTR